MEDMTSAWNRRPCLGSHETKRSQEKAGAREGDNNMMEERSEVKHMQEACLRKTKRETAEPLWVKPPHARTNVFKLDGVHTESHLLKMSSLQPTIQLVWGAKSS